MTEDRPIAIPPDTGRSWWLRDALADDAGEPAAPLRHDTEADVVVLGGGYTGMWTALHLTDLDPGAKVAIVEADICGGGASGRNGGFVNSFWGDLDYLVRHFGDRQAVALCEAGETSVRAIGAFCDEHGIDAWYRPDGEYVVAASEDQVGHWADDLITADRLGLSEHFQVLDREEMRSRISSPVFRGALYRKVGATVHPARLARGMRRVLMERGVRIFEDTPVTRFGAGAPAVAETPDGTIRAGTAVIALNAWAHHWKRFRRTVVVRGSYIVLTGRAPEQLEAIGWTDGSGLADMRSSVHYVRTTPDGRISFGVGGMQPDLARRIGPRFAYDERAIGLAIRDLHRMFPTFADVPIEAAWGGPIDVSGHHLPTFGTLERGNVHYGHGYTGNGVGPAHLGGRIIASRILGRTDPVLDLPLVDLEPLRFPPEPIRSPGALVANRAIRRLDDAHDAGEDANPLVEFVAKLPRRLGYNLGP
ncbi:MAG TPA: FAD-binding oxidoreductase [Actinomycetota bacterium]|nr:FAD-binding oxidoreductase [Actinomycetota bacterium]